MCRWPAVLLPACARSWDAAAQLDNFPQKSGGSAPNRRGRPLWNRLRPVLVTRTTAPRSSRPGSGRSPVQCQWPASLIHLSRLIRPKHSPVTHPSHSVIAQRPGQRRFHPARPRMPILAPRGATPLNKGAPRLCARCEFFGKSVPNP